VRGYEPRGREFESLRARHKINGLSNCTSSVLSQVNGQNWTYRDIVVQLVSGAPGRVVRIRVAI